MTSEQILRMGFAKLMELAQKRNKERQAAMTNGQLFDETGVINLTEDSNGVFIWLPKSCERGEQPTA